MDRPDCGSERQPGFGGNAGDIFRVRSRTGRASHCASWTSGTLLLTRYLWSPAVDQLLAEEAHVKQGIDITFAFQAGEYEDGDNNNSG